ncbi:MAG: PHP domain-containing protein [Chloroflexota bacterium]|nr:PHP domain-containing protein [Chloroflexota bacterium]MDE2959372.1 PHP domain-containing protein [Chloroflexota bacterium]
MAISVDLHLHTTASDGRLTPTELVELTASKGLRTISVSDHDTTAGLEEAQQAVNRIPGMRLIPGIELSCDVPGGEVHMLGYFMDIEDSGFQEMLAGFREGRLARGEGMVRKLAEFGMYIEWERVLEIAGDASVGRPHIAQALVEKGYFPEPSEAFREYLGRNGKAYVERSKLTPPDAVKLLNDVGGVAVFAHPWFERRGNEPEPEQSLIETVEELKAAGLHGMEVHYAMYDEATVDWLADVARAYDLIPCGGSDYHHSGNSREPLPGVNGPPLETVERLEDAARRLASRR